MTHRERVHVTLAHEEVDRVPCDLGGGVSSLTQGAYERLTRHLGIVPSGEVGEFKVMKRIDEEILELLDVDFRHVFLRPPLGWEPKVYEDGTFEDEWGIRYKDIGYYTEIVRYPLAHATLEGLETYSWPDFLDSSRVRSLKEETEWLFEHTDYAIALGSVGGRIIEQSQWLRGIEQFLLDLVANVEFAEALMDKILELQKQFFGLVLSEIGEYLEVVVLGDDLASQDRLLFSPEIYRKLIKPRQYALITFIKERTSAKVMYHSDGAVYPLIPDLLEIGVDILNPVQPQAKGMDMARLKKEFGNRISFWGGIDIQYVLPFGSSEEIRRAVRRAIETLGNGGGYILAPAHNVQPDVPPESIVTMYQEAKNYKLGQDRH